MIKSKRDELIQFKKSREECIKEKISYIFICSSGKYYNIEFDYSYLEINMKKEIYDEMIEYFREYYNKNIKLFKRYDETMSIIGGGSGTLYKIKEEYISEIANYIYEILNNKENFYKLE